MLWLGFVRVALHSLATPATSLSGGGGGVLKEHWRLSRQRYAVKSSHENGSLLIR
jgi:hypothetical protein